MMTTKQEDFTNRSLALLLKEQGLDADYEQRAGRKKIDVVIQVEGLRVVLEAETGHQRRAQAIKEADDRLRQSLATLAFALYYPNGVTEENLPQQTLNWTLRTKAGEPDAQWTSGDISQLTQAIRQAPRSLGDTDKAAQLLSISLDVAVQRLTPKTRADLARILDLPPSKAGTGQPSDRYMVAAKRGMLVVATAMLFHRRLQDHLPILRPAGYDGPWPPSSATICLEQEEVIGAHREAWRGILAVDYRPVFETARAALGAISTDPDTNQAVRALGETVAQVSGLVAGLRHDLLGRIFHRVLDTAQYDGSFYTSTAAAVLLASLAIRTEEADWSSPNAVAALRICDPACGTGTLLMAAAERIRDLRTDAGKTDPADQEALDLLLVEDVLWGYDINLSATHMAASTLGMLSPTTQFNRMNIHRTLMGVFGGIPYLGSLDFLAGQPRLAAWPSLTQQVDTHNDSSGDDSAAMEMPPPMDLVIMNPPFTRDSLRHDQFNQKEELAIKNREKEVMAGQPYREAARLHSSGGAFTVLGERLLKKDVGTLALILPSVVPTAPGNLEVRRYLAQRFHIDTIVSSHDPERIFFSENTSIGEVLLICRRWASLDPKPPTRLINLAINPSTPVEALDLVARIENADDGQETPGFTVQHIEPDRIQKGDWSAVNFLSPFLVNSWRRLSEKNTGVIPMVPLSQLAQVGPEGRRIRDSYNHSNLPTESGRRALWYHKTNVTQSMAANPDVYIEPKEDKKNLADSYWEQRSSMLLPHRMRLNLARVAAVKLPEQVVGSIWVPCNMHNPELANALCTYLNSSPGLLSLIGSKDNRIPSYPSFSLDTLRSLPVPDLATLSPERLGLLENQFNKLQHEILQPFPKMGDDPIRRQIDEAVTQALGLDPEWVQTISRELAHEPSVTDRRAGT